MNFKSLIALCAFSLLSTSAFAGFLKEGGYLGNHNGDDKVNLLVKPAPGREGSFFAVLMKDEEKISLYLVDEINSNSYSMTPLEVTTDGEIGVVNDDPSLVISMAKNKKGQDVFKIMSANSGNNVGFTGFFEFEGKESKVSWLAVDDGQYKKGSSKNALQISQIDPKEREATAVFITDSINGTYTLKEKFPSMYLINQNSVLATGTQKKQIPSAIGIFLQKKSLLGGKCVEMQLVDPKNDTNITTFTKK
ncbi:MAG: hypothetical protein KBD76_11375 [Bacteriovorax sp.]|nr:hypothetical protein [Bacteriovorax sp.]